MSAYDDAIAALYQAPLSDFVTERKRLAGELKQSGDKDGAARVVKLARPPISAWAVNQLWWLERDAFEDLLKAAAQVKAGDREASRAHREALSVLRERATRLLQGSGNSAAEATLRRVTTTLSAIAALGGFDPDPPGALASDRDPPGFEALGFAAAAPSEAKPKPKDDAQARAAEAARRRAEAEAHERRAREREQLSTQLREARSLQTAQQRELSRLRAEADAAEQSLKTTQTLLAELETKLASL